MDVHQVLHMNGGEEDTSYAKNSSIQKSAILKIKQIIEESIKDLCSSSLPAECVRIADLGCSSGPNALIPTWEIILSIDKAYRQLNHRPPPIQVFLNDLPTNDFSTVFKLLPGFYKKLEKELGLGSGSCSVAAVPGSFHGRLFPEHSIHVIFSSNSLHWLSKVPEGLVTDSGMPLNKGRINVSESSHLAVHDAYLNQFRKDLVIFLSMRFQELAPRGRLILTLVGKNEKNDGSEFSVLLGELLNDMVMEGLVDEAVLDMFNLPIYTPSLEEVKHIIESEGSFEIQRLENYKERWDASMATGDNQVRLIFDDKARGVFAAMHARAIFEPILVNQFGKATMDHLFLKLAQKASEYLQTRKGWSNYLVIYLTKKLTGNYK